MRDHWLTDLAFGGLSGLAAAWVMERVQTLGSDSSAAESEEERTSEERHKTESSDPATVKAAQTAASLVGMRIPEDRKNLAGEIVHFSYAALWGGLYALAAPKKTNAFLSGLAFGTGLWLVSDEILVPLLGWAKWAPAYPASTHAKALAAHLAYGVSTAAGLAALKAGAQEVARAG